MDNITEEALALIHRKYSCSQAVLGAFAEKYGLPRKVALRIATPFGGGISRTGRMCGAVSGGLMVIGLMFGITSPEEKDKKEATYLLAKEFLTRFSASKGSVECPSLIGFDISQEEELQKAREKGIFDTLCPEFVRQAVDILLELQNRVVQD